MHKRLTSWLGLCVACALLCGCSRPLPAQPQQSAKSAATSNDPVAGIRAALDDENLPALRQAVRLARRGSDGSNAVLPFLIELLHEQDPKRRAMARIALVEYGPPAIGHVVETLDRETQAPRRAQLVDALGQFGTNGAEAVQALTTGLADPDPELRRAAADALGEIGAADNDAMAALSHALADQEPRVRVTAATALWRIDGRVDETLPVLVAVVKTGDITMQRNAIRALELMGGDARDAIPTLVEAAKIRALRADVRDAIRRIQSIGRGPGGHRATREAISGARRAAEDEESNEQSRQ